MAKFSLGSRVTIDRSMFQEVFSHSHPYPEKIYTIVEILQTTRGVTKYKIDAPAIRNDSCIWPERWLVPAPKSLTLIRKERIK